MACRNMEPIDVVVTTRVTSGRMARLGYLKNCLSFIAERTQTPHRVIVIDDASDARTGARELLLDMQSKGKIHVLKFRKERWGQRANLNLGFDLSRSDPIVFTDDDVLCPDVKPDWLKRLLDAMNAHRDFGVVALNSPGKNYIRTEKGGARGKFRTVGPITECKAVPGHMVAVQRRVLTDWRYPNVKGQNIRTSGQYFPDTQRCQRTKKLGLRIGYLTDTYCYHCGDVPVRADKPTETILKPVDMKTLRPPKEWAW